MFRNTMLALLIIAAAPTIARSSTSPVSLTYKEDIVTKDTIEFISRKSVRDIIKGILKKRNRNIPLREEYYLTPPHTYIDKTKLV